MSTPPFKVSIRGTRSGPFGKELRQRTDRLTREVQQAAEKGAERATRYSQKNADSLRKTLTPPRAGRQTTGGKFASHVRWVRDGSGVKLDIDALDRSSRRYWRVQEIGTNARAKMLSGGEKAARWGSKGKGSDKLLTVPSQKGRVIAAGLVWGNGGRYYQSSRRRGKTRMDQIMPAANLSHVPYGYPRVVIRREIEGKHFVRTGGEEGYRVYRKSVLAAAQRAFERRP